MAKTPPSLAKDQTGHRIQALRPLSTQKASFTGTSAAITSAVDGVVMITATTDCHVRFGETPTAVATDAYIVADTPYYFRIQDEKIAAIRDTVDGDLWVTLMD